MLKSNYIPHSKNLNFFEVLNQKLYLNQSQLSILQVVFIVSALYIAKAALCSHISWPMIENL